MPEDFSYLQYCDNQSSTDPRGSAAIQPIDPKISPKLTAMLANAPQETREALARQMAKYFPVEELTEKVVNARSAEQPAWLKEPEHNPAIQAPAADRHYDFQLDGGGTIEGRIAVNNGLRRIGVPAAIAPGLVQTLQDANKALAGLEGEARASALENAQTTLIRTYGPDRTQAMLDKADMMAKQLGQTPGFVEAVGGADAFFSASAVVAASNAYDLLQYGKNKK